MTSSSDLHLALFDYFAPNRFYPLLYSAGEHPPTIIGVPNDMVLARVDNLVVGFVFHDNGSLSTPIANAQDSPYLPRTEVRRFTAYLIILSV